MANIYFRNTKNWTSVYAVLYSKDEKVRESVKLTQVDADGDFVFAFDCEKYDHLQFASSDDSAATEIEETSKLFPGKFSLGVEYKWNAFQERDLTYLFSKEDKVTGHVDTYVFEDKVNLSYREDASKKIHVFVPASYDEKMPHEVLYFFDAQNLFSGAGQYTDKNDPYGGWQLDVVLNAVYHQYGRNVLVVGIENADMYRELELFMEPTDFGKLSPLATDIPEEVFVEGHLDELSTFMLETVHPYIKKKYNIDEENIGIGGSSMGGIAAFYCAMKELGFYKYVLSYSPAYGLYEMEAFENFFKRLQFGNNKAKLPKVHIYCGEADDLEKQLVVSSRKMKETMVRYGYDESLVLETYDADKVHNEEAWRLILPQSFSCLLNL